MKKGNKYRVYKDGEVEYSREPDEPTPIYASLEDNNDGEGTKTLVFTVAENTKEGAINLGQLADNYNSSNNIPPWSANDSYRTSITKAEIRDVVKPKKSTGAWFYNLNNLTSISNMENLYTGNVDNMAAMFQGCSNLIELDVKRFDTGNVTYMYGMFDGCKKIEKLDVSNFDTSKVTSFNVMFYNCEKITELDVTDFDTSNAYNIGLMFGYCRNLNKLDVSGFDTGKVTSMNATFSGCNNLSEIDVSNFNTNKVTNMASMFNGCSNLKKLDLSNFNTENVIHIMNMFYNCSGLTATITINPTKIEYYVNPTTGISTIGYDRCFVNAATEPEAKIIVRCKAEHREEVQKIVNTRSVNSNVVLEVIN